MNGKPSYFFTSEKINLLWLDLFFDYNFVESQSLTEAS
jgi:hypothetical protein